MAAQRAGGISMKTTFNKQNSRHLFKENYFTFPVNVLAKAECVMASILEKTAFWVFFFFLFQCKVSQSLTPSLVCRLLVKVRVGTGSPRCHLRSDGEPAILGGHRGGSLCEVWCHSLHEPPVHSPVVGSRGSGLGVCMAMLGRSFTEWTISKSQFPHLQDVGKNKTQLTVSSDGARWRSSVLCSG